MQNFLQNTNVSPKLDVSLSDIFFMFFFSKLNLGPSQKNSGLTLAPLGGAKGPPCGFSQIAPEVLGISL